MSLKSLDLSGFAHIEKTTPKSQKWDFIGPRAGKRKKEKVLNIAVITPCPGKGFKFRGELYPKFAEVLDLIKAAGVYDAYRQGGVNGKVIRLAA